MQLEQNACGNTRRMVSISWPKVNSHLVPLNQKLHVHTHTSLIKSINTLLSGQWNESGEGWMVMLQVWGHCQSTGRTVHLEWGVCVCVCAHARVFPSQHLRRFLFWIGPAGFGSGKSCPFTLNGKKVPEGVCEEDRGRRRGQTEM